MRGRTLVLWCALAPSLVAGCGGVRNNESSGVRPPVSTATATVTASVRPASDNDKLVAYYEHVRKLAPAELTKEHDAVRALYANANSDFVRVRYAMLLSVPGAAFSDDARALEALEPLLKSPGAALHSLAFMVSAQIQEQRRGQGLQQKLEALKSLEKSLSERDPGAGKKR
jgi:hypothetical protein